MSVLSRIRTVWNLLLAGAFGIGAAVAALVGAVAFLLIMFGGGGAFVEWVGQQPVFLQILAAAAVLTLGIPAIAFLFMLVFIPAAALGGSAGKALDKAAAKGAESSPQAVRSGSIT